MIETYAIIEIDTITNVIVIDSGDPKSIAAFNAVPLPPSSGIGYTLINGIWTAPIPPPFDDPIADEVTADIQVDLPTIAADVANLQAAVPAVPAFPASPVSSPSSTFTVES